MSGLTPLDIWKGWYKDQGIDIFPLYGILNGRCRCQLGAQCRNAGKHPKRRDWQNSVGTYVASTDNVGVSTHNLVVIDIDNPHIADPSKYPKTFMTQTNKGYHLWYRADPSTPIMTKVAWRPSVDIRAIGGLIVAPPSKHLSGKIYEPVNEEPIQEVPQALLELLPHKADQEKLGREVNLNTQTTSDLILPLLESICNRVRYAQMGQRNQELFRQTCQVLRYIDSEQMGIDALQALADAAEENGLTEQEILTTFNSAKRSL